jgi:hypothetical protein
VVTRRGALDRLAARSELNAQLDGAHHSHAQQPRRPGSSSPVIEGGLYGYKQVSRSVTRALRNADGVPQGLHSEARSRLDSEKSYVRSLR